MSTSDSSDPGAERSGSRRDPEPGSGLSAEQVALLQELSRTSQQLFEAFSRQPREGSVPQPQAASPGEGQGFADGLKKVLKLRARRRRTPEGEVFEWPAWDMLLDLAAVRAEGGHISVSAVCISSGAPQSTALRKLAGLESAGLVTRYSHGEDQRRVNVGLTDKGLQLVNATLADEIAIMTGTDAFL
ncbi:hypothetical protein [Roseomonas chloroacetimidivorans]|jgi:hypothetical protein|uniref:hypothetical protein n=1 Tax=Roseomonas chloroacetimidivorans TaxID=1766656 RepID=UPI003C70C90D